MKAQGLHCNREPCNW